MLSILIPVFNEERVIADTVRSIHRSLTDAGEDFEIVVVDDGSTDGTGDILAGLGLPKVAVLRQPMNRGYSASLKTGIRHSAGEIIGIIDADGTYPVNDFPKLLKEMRETKADMVVGKRPRQQIPWIRRPGKAIVNALANTLTGTRIPDLNSGMRVFTRPLALSFMHLYPQRFSFTMTITLGALTNDYLVRYVPIEYGKRIGSSTMSSGFNGLKNLGQFCSLVIRIVTYFRPLRFFAWPTLILTGTGVGLIAYTVATQSNVSDSGLLLTLTGIQIGLFGLVAETIARNKAR